MVLNPASPLPIELVHTPEGATALGMGQGSPQPGHRTARCSGAGAVALGSPGGLLFSFLSTSGWGGATLPAPTYHSCSHSHPCCAVLHSQEPGHYHGVAQTSAMALAPLWLRSPDGNCAAPARMASTHLQQGRGQSPSMPRVPAPSPLCSPRHACNSHWQQMGPGLWTPMQSPAGS